jgi:hypothetical protein
MIWDLIYIEIHTPKTYLNKIALGFSFPKQYIPVSTAIRVLSYCIEEVAGIRPSH